LKVYVIPADAYACGHYRLIWPADVLRRQGMDITIVPPSEESGFMVKAEDDPTMEGGKRLVSVRIPEGADLFVLQRPAHPLQPQLIRMLRANGIAVVVDMDDDMSSIHPDNVAFRTYRTRSSTPFNWRSAGRSCKEATLVTTSTRALLKTYARPGRGVVVDNYVPAATLGYAQRPGGVASFGWAGTTQSHPNDLQVTGTAIQRLIDDGHSFRVVGGPSKVRSAARLRTEPDYTGSVGLDQWIKTIGDSYRVGLIPLAPSQFNTAKSRLKGIEHMAAGRPWVASPRDEYRRLVKESGCGLLADNPKEWYVQVRRLLTDDVLYKEQVEAGTEYIQGQTFEVNASLWREAWTLAVQLEKGTSPPPLPGVG
jgi:glycosyl transferase family 1